MPDPVTGSRASRPPDHRSNVSIMPPEHDTHATAGDVAASQQPTAVTAAWRKDRPPSADHSSSGLPISPLPTMIHTLRPHAASDGPPDSFTWASPAAGIRFHVRLPAADRYSAVTGQLVSS